MEGIVAIVQQLIPLFVIVIIGFGLFGVWLFWVSQRRSERRRERAKSPQAEQPAGAGLLDRLVGGGETQSAPAPGPSTATSIVDSSASTGDAVEVFRVLRDLADGSLVVEIDGRQYRRLVDITDGQIGRRFVTNARALAHFAMLLKGPAPAPPPMQPDAAAPPAPAPELSRLDDIVPAPTPAAAPADDEQPAELINIADQIEALLQRQLLTRPDLMHRAIHVRPSFGGGVRIVVDEVSYASVDEVPDDDVREFVQETIRLWNARA